MLDALRIAVALGVAEPEADAVTVGLTEAFAVPEAAGLALGVAT